jgi:hypothetical protein
VQWGWRLGSRRYGTASILAKRPKSISSGRVWWVCWCMFARHGQSGNMTRFASHYWHSKWSATEESCMYTGNSDSKTLSLGVSLISLNTWTMNSSDRVLDTAVSAWDSLKTGFSMSWSWKLKVSVSARSWESHLGLGKKSRLHVLETAVLAQFSPQDGFFNVSALAWSWDPTVLVSTPSQVSCEYSHYSNPAVIHIDFKMAVTGAVRTELATNHHAVCLISVCQYCIRWQPIAYWHPKTPISPDVARLNVAQCLFPWYSHWELTKHSWLLLTAHQLYLA